ncbi:PREDICTED: uncharacterized protein LOC106750091 [Dinoponera quadriceps]|uniref:Uncharacterized protein LOC106750091 n=1 Tax=Dinoponera quadriceps TaxID=609295 RepID=A0A6P3Y6G0_DINQU|nr:PREDICTED: uncharacterized protein LOC106750091 [Dinoponera quadriceps]XP_014485659.1 PREDICTED: uncharacterized protein LOC106750091 [Dinoponera quadriceps]XP_014485661.1 PREDICTED: uncharacterized protein LOC106750091 [Dinoponera quadriceps]
MRPLLEMLLVVVALATHTRGLPYGELPHQLQPQEQVVYYGDDGVPRVQGNILPNYKENVVPGQISQAPFNWDQSQQSAFAGYETHAPSESQQQQQQQHNPDYVYQPDQTLQTYPNSLNDLTITCSGQDEVCVSKSLCVDGYVHHLKQGFTRPGQVQECKLSSETCCTVRYDVNNSPYDEQYNTVLKDDRYNHQYPEPSLENDQKYVQYGEDNQADAVQVNPPLGGNEAELQSGTNDGYAIDSVGQPHDNVKAPEEVPLDYNQVSGSSPREQFQEGSVIDSEPVAPAANPAANPAIFQFPIQSGCAAALLCVEEQYCTLEGVISPEPVALTSKQLLRRVPLSSCRNQETGVIGKCCRDPNYVDPWPTGNLPANYTGGFDEQGFPTFLNIEKVPPPTKKPQQPTKTIPKPVRPPVVQPPQFQEQHPTNVVPLVPEDSNVPTPHVLPVPTQVVPEVPIVANTPEPFTKKPYYSDSSDQQPTAVVPQVPSNPCGVRNYDQRPTGFRETDAAFAEIPWQAMVLWSPERKILCSGALVAPNAVLTAASCVSRYSPDEISVKLGEWKLGFEVEQEEPLPFEIINVQTIRYHPGYIEGLFSNDTAMLILEHPASFNLHINTLCLPEDYQVQETSRCIVTGWGKSILQAHYAGAIMHMVDVDLLSREVCQSRVLNAESPISIANDVICGKARDENNMCQADVGGPLACYDGNGAYHIAGIYSQDTGCLPTNQVATFAPIDLLWVKQSMHFSSGPEAKIDVAPTSYVDDGYDYRKSNLPAGNQYLPPV